MIDIYKLHGIISVETQIPKHLEVHTVINVAVYLQEDSGWIVKLSILAIARTTAQTSRRHM